jgi:hypothetical protein
VASPDPVLDVLRQNEWLKAQLEQPVGQGLLGGWAGVLGSRGQDLRAGFEGALADLIATKVLGSPFDVVWFSSGPNRGAPALVVHAPTRSAEAAFSALDAATRQGTVTAASCPGRGAVEGEKPLVIARWVVAAQPLYAARAEKRLVLSTSAPSVLHALCRQAAEAKAAEGVDVTVAFAPSQLGREAQLLAHLLGLGDVARLQLAVGKGGTLVPKGLAAQIASAARLGAAPPSEDLLRLVPADAPVSLTLQLKLPDRLDPASLKAFFAQAGGGGPVVERQVGIVWSPRGDPNLPTEVALAWSRPEDAMALKALFEGANALRSEVVCRHVVLSSSEGLLRQLDQGCRRRAPSLMDAAPAVTAGYRQAASVRLGIHFGRLLPQLLLDGYWSDVRLGAAGGLPKAPPAEIEAARRALEALPFFGFTGVAKGAELVPAGFRS